MTIWTNYNLPPAALDLLTRGVADQPGCRLVFSPNLLSTNLTAGPPDPALPQADIAFGQPDPAAFGALPKLKWIHLTSAGYERYDLPHMRQSLQSRGIPLTNSSSVYAEPCAQHVLAMMLALGRRLPDSWDNQRSPRAWIAGPIRAKSFLLAGQTVLILGFGAIGRRLVELLAPLHMDIQAIRRSPRPDDPVPTHAPDALLRLLPQADHVINILPASSATTAFVTAAHFAAMKPTAIFYNIGRGSTIDQAALRKALETSRLAAAYLDVTQPKPPPPDDPLWTTPNCYITPHTAGGHHDEQQRLVQHFLANLQRYQSQRPLFDRVV